MQESTSSLEHFDADGVVVVASEPAGAQETLASRRSLDALTAAVNSAMFASRAETGVSLLLLQASQACAVFLQHCSAVPGVPRQAKLLLQVLGEEGCSICEWVHEHLRLLWCIVYANVALLAGCIVIAAVRQYSMRSEAVPTIPVRSMPLITIKLDVLVAAHLLGNETVLICFGSSTDQLLTAYCRIRPCASR